MAAASITELRSGIGYVQSVTNPLPAGGGTAVEDGDVARARATARLSHRDRAVSAADYEWIAREATPEVARARCLPLDAPPGRPLRGWVTVVIVPHTLAAAPAPSPELVDRVLTYVRARVPAGVPLQVRVLGPSYVQIGVHAEIVLSDRNRVAEVEARIRALLAGFLHPLTGNDGGRGFDFGEPIYLSQFAGLLESVDGVDFVRRLQLEAGGSLAGDVIAISADALPAAGDHELKFLQGTR